MRSFRHRVPRNSHLRPTIAAAATLATLLIGTSCSPAPAGTPASPPATTSPPASTAPPATTSPPAPTTRPGPTPTRVFAASSYMWDPIPPHPVLDPTSPEVAAELAEPAAHRVVNLDSYGVPVYGVTPATPRHRIVPSASSTVDGIYGVTSALENGPVPIPDGARPAPGCDRKLVMIDPAAGTVFDLFSARSPGGVTPNPDCPAPTPSAWTADWGGVYALTGEGLGDVNPDGPQSAGTGSGLSSLFGLIRVEEVNAGVIDHALVFSTDRSCTWERWPAVKTDGRYVGWPCIPEGARVQLDPSVDLRAIPGITPFELAVGRALQTYGAYNIDNGGARLAFIAERETSVRYDRRTVDPAVDYAGLPHLPWSSLRVLRSWNGK